MDMLLGPDPAKRGAANKGQGKGGQGGAGHQDQGAGVDLNAIAHDIGAAFHQAHGLQGAGGEEWEQDPSRRCLLI